MAARSAASGPEQELTHSHELRQSGSGFACMHEREAPMPARRPLHCGWGDGMISIDAIMLKRRAMPNARRIALAVATALMALTAPGAKADPPVIAQPAI